MKISKFDFEKDWHLVEPHLNDPEVSKLLDQGMLRLSLIDKWVHLPLWDPENGHGPWEYTKTDTHAQYAFDRVFEDPQMGALNQKYGEKLEKEGFEWEALYDYDGEDPKVFDIVESYEDEVRKIEKKYYPKENTYRWYQCFGAADFLSGWSKKLAEKTFPNYMWKTYRKYGWKKFTGLESKLYSGCTTTIGKNENGDFIIFDIILFDKSTIDGILEAVGLNANKLQQEFKNAIKKHLLKISREIKRLAKQTEMIAVEIGKMEAKESKSKTTKTSNQ